MPERQQDLGKTPDKAPGQNLTTADRLTLAYSARQDFARAFGTADTIEEPGFSNDRINAFIDIGIELARSGLDYSEATERLSQLSQDTDKDGLQDFYDGITRIHIVAGNFDTAEETLQKARSSLGSLPESLSDHRFYLYLARHKAIFSQDPRPELDKAHHVIQKHEVTYGPRIKYYAELAQAQFRLTGEYPNALLSKVESDIEDYARKNPDGVHVRGLYGDIAKAYATCGSFEKALQTIDKIKGYNPIHEAEMKTGALKHIAEEQIGRGLYEDAIGNARLAIQTIEQTEIQPEYLAHHLISLRREGVAKLLVLVAKAQGLNGEDSSLSFALAMGRIEEIRSGGSKANLLIEVAKAEEDIGIDSTPTLDLATRHLDEIPEKDDYDGYYGLASQIFGYEDLAKAQLEFDKIDAARTTLSRLENFAADENSKDISRSAFALSLARIGQASAKKGLSPTEIDNLSPEEIREILNSPNELASQAVVYFELEKKLL